MTLTDMQNAIECRSTAREYAAVQQAMLVYDYMGGLSNDEHARAAACFDLEANLGIPDLDAAQLLAGALSRRATLRSQL